jgi:hypothetical protein
MQAASLLVALALCEAAVAAGEEGKKADPALTSIFPLGSRPGSALAAVIRGENLEGARNVWFDCDHLKAKIQEIRTVDLNAAGKRPQASEGYAEPPKAKNGQEVHVLLEVDATAPPGAHSIRLVTPRGVTDELWFIVNAEPVVAETDQRNSTIAEAQPVAFPVVVTGKLGERGELDYYSFEVGEKQQLQFELVSFPFIGGNSVSDPQLILYQPTGSWFDPKRGVRLEVEDLWRPPPGEQPQTTSHRLPRVMRTFEKAGRYVVEVGTIDGMSGPDYSYQLRIVAINHANQKQERWGPLVALHEPSRVSWRKRTFTTPISDDALARLCARATGSAATSPSPLIAEKEPDDLADDAVRFPIPAVLSGTIGRPADVDRFQFEAKSGDRFAFEIETPYLPPPFFNPRLTIVGPGNQEIASNIFRSLGGDGDDWIKTPMAKTLVSVDKPGSYRLEIRDLTSRFGGEEYAYRVLVRRQIPHLGEVLVRALDHVNLPAGTTKRLNVITDLEEGFQGEVALTVENLPPGVSAYPGVTTDVEKNLIPMAKPGGEIHRERHFPRRYFATIVLMAASNAPSTQMPQAVRILARPIAGGKPGESLPVQQFLLAVMKAGS